MYIPFESLSAEAQQGLIEAFVLREGTDYGPVEYSFEEKCRMVRLQLASGKALIEFDSDGGAGGAGRHGDHTCGRRRRGGSRGQPRARFS